MSSTSCSKKNRWDLLRLGAKSKRGQGTVEFALAFPMVAFVILAFLELGLGFYAYVTVVYAAREGARIGALYEYVDVPGCTNPTPSQCRQNANDTNRANAVQAAVSRSLGWLPAANLATPQVTYNPTTSEFESRMGDTINVSVTYNYNILTQMLGRSSITLAGSASARIE